MEKFFNKSDETVNFIFPVIKVNKKLQFLVILYLNNWPGKWVTCTFFHLSFLSHSFSKEGIIIQFTKSQSVWFSIGKIIA